MNRRECLNTLVAELGRGQLSFPTSTAAALRVRQALEDPDCATEVASRLIQAEPVLAARVVALANSVAFNRSGRLVTDVRTAVNMLGFSTINVLATVMMARQMMAAAKAPADIALAKKLWEHTAHVASLAQLLARRVTHQDPETAMFAGMLHEIGGFYLLYRSHDFPGLLAGDASEWVGTSSDEDDHTPERDIGRAVLAALGVPEPVNTAIEALWKGYLAFPPSTLGDTLLLAYELSPVKSPLREALVKPDEARRAHIDMVIGQETLQHILQESGEEVASLFQALKA